MREETVKAKGSGLVLKMRARARLDERARAGSFPVKKGGYMSHRISIEDAEKLKMWGRAMGSAHGKTVAEDMVKVIYSPMYCKFECEICGASGHYKMGNQLVCPVCNGELSS